MFENGIADYKRFTVAVDCFFPIDDKGNTHGACKFCNLFTGRKCIVTGYAPIDSDRYVAYKCPILESEGQE